MVRLKNLFVSSVIFLSFTPCARSMVAINSLGMSQANEAHIETTALDIQSRFEQSEKSYQFVVDGAGLYTLHSDLENYLNLRELYYSWLADSWSLSLGRKKLSLSQSDEFWQLGLWQPMFRANQLYPEQQGLVGAHLNWQNAGWSVNFSSSSIFVPDQTPQVEQRKDELVSDSSWFHLPYDSVNIGAQKSTLQYRLEKPSVEEVIRQQSFLFSAGFKNSNYWVSVAGANKPANQLLLAIEPRYSMALNDSNGITQVVIHPTVVRHNLVSVEAGLSGEKSRQWISLTREVVEKADLPEHWLAKEFPSQVVASAFYERNSRLFGKNSLITLGYLHRTEYANNREKFHSPIDMSRQSYQLRELFKNALRVQVQKRIWFGKSYAAQLQTSLTHDFEWLTDTFSVQTDFTWAKNLTFQLGFDIIGVDDSHTEAPLYAFRTNDKFWSGLRYVF